MGGVLEKDPAPHLTARQEQTVKLLESHKAPFRRYPECFLCLVGLSPYYPFDDNSYPAFERPDGTGGCYFLLVVSRSRRDIYAERPEKFTFGQNLNRWQTEDVLLSSPPWVLTRFLKETVPQGRKPLQQRSNSNEHSCASYGSMETFRLLMGHNYVLNGLIDPLYNVYCKTTTAKELWESLERKYKTEDAEVSSGNLIQCDLPGHHAALIASMPTWVNPRQAIVWRMRMGNDLREAVDNGLKLYMGKLCNCLISRNPGSMIKEERSLPVKGDTGGVDPAGEEGGVSLKVLSGFAIIILLVTLIAGS
ncbi:hypothetical protein Tco_0622760 [Tanacetum coccineum]